MIWDIVIGILIGAFLFMAGFIIHGSLMIGKDDNSLSKKKKIFGYLAPAIFVILGIWIFYRGIVGQEPHIKMICGIGIFLFLSSLLMFATMFSLKPVDVQRPLDYGD